jgi:tetratricopeptide (TPR) repeat protein
MKIDKLKAKARQHEQREEWGQAMALYSRALEHVSEQDEVDIALHNRMGDLQVRIGDVRGAVESYETAIDLYLEADLANNAMAVCRKLERNAPNRPEVLLRMGQIRVRQGFVVDARQDFLSYAELQLAGGDVEEALRALEEFASLAPTDVETRLFLAEQLHRVDRTDDAVRHFRQGYGILVREGRQEEADGVRARVAQIAPDVDLDLVPPDPAIEEAAEGKAARGASGGLAGFESTALAGLELESPSREGTEDAAGPEDAAEEEPAAGEDREVPEAEAPDEDEAPVEAEAPVEDDEDPMAALEGAVFELDDDAPAPDDGEDPASTREPEGVRSPAEADVVHPDDEPPDEGDSPLPMLEEEDRERPTDLPFLEEPTEAPPAEAPGPQVTAAAVEVAEAPEPPARRFDDPPLSSDPVPGAADSVEELRARARRAPDDGDAWRRLGVALFAGGVEEEGREALERAHRAHGKAGDAERAMRVVRELIFHEPGEIAHYQRLVEYAHRTGDRALMVPAFLELADALARSGSSKKAEVVYGQVLELDPRNPRAREALYPGAVEAADAERGKEGLVRLGGLVLDERPRDSFRWKIADAGPSGNEEADFARMLARFKQEVARDVPSDDATSHYDLGAAYKEMGLYDEAVGQFQAALRAHPTHLAAYEMVGQCFLEKGEPEAAMRALQRAVDMNLGKVEDELLGIYYYLGKANEAVGNREAAVEFYERVFSLDINFEDVTDRLRELR